MGIIHFYKIQNVLERSTCEEDLKNSHHRFKMKDALSEAFFQGKYFSNSNYNKLEILCMQVDCL